MHIEAVIIPIVILTEGFFENLILSGTIEPETEKLVSIVVTITIATIIGFLGNFFYVRKADKFVQLAKARYSDNEEQKIFLRKKGGVSFIFLIPVIILILVIFIYNNFAA